MQQPLSAPKPVFGEIHRFSALTHKREGSVARITARAIGPRGGLRVEIRQVPATSEVQQSYFLGHTLVVSDAEPKALTVSWKDGPTFHYSSNESSPCPRVGIYPAQWPFSGQWSWATVLPSGPCRLILIELDSELVARARGGEPMAQDRLAPGYVEDGFIFSAAHLLGRIAEQDDPRGREEVDAIGAALCTYVANRYLVASKAAEEADARLLPPQLLKKVDDYIDKHIDECLSLESLARVARMSPFHFARLFKLSAKVTPHAHVLKRRIERAQTLLRRSDLSVSDVAQMCGFSQQSHLAQTFRRVVGVSPAQYRRASGLAMRVPRTAG